VIGGGLICASWAALLLSRGIRLPVLNSMDPDGSAQFAPMLGKRDRTEGAEPP
jgi:hypothetical protein